MGINIELEDGFVLTSDKVGFSLSQKKVKGDKSENAGEEFMEKVGEYSTLEGSFNGYIRNRVLRSDCDSLNAISGLLKSIKDELPKLFTVEVKKIEVEA